MSSATPSTSSSTIAGGSATSPAATYSLGFLGGGMMCEALLGGIVRNQLVPASKITVSDVTPDRLAYLKKTYGVNVTEDNAKVVLDSDVIIIAVKPQAFGVLCTQLGGAADRATVAQKGPAKVFVSIMAGVTLKTLVSSVGSYGEVIRVMPNTPALVNAAASAYAVAPFKDESATPKIAFVESIFSAIGVCCQVSSESYLDAVTGLSGSGPAYVYMMIEAMSDGGVKQGLPRALAMKLAAQTVFGAAKLVLEKGEHPAVLKNAVESPGGTTIAGTGSLEASGFRGSVIAAVSAATERSRELGTQA
ncbi:unnamed protein product [Amoebophrya sp. A25]|nr:unnamed protein product [Amoebophrya sp. A25]|eukprot:GSA25T00012812001.1